MAQGQVIETKEILLRVVKDINSYKEKVDSIMKSIVQMTNELNDDWKDAQYTKFQAYIYEIKKDIDTDMQGLDECVQKLLEKANLY